jgi:thiamine-monophosphate kinase
MSEFDLIRDYFTRPTNHTQLGIGDDAALISIKPGMELAISADMLVAGTHFFADADPYKVGWKSLAVNLSDMAAMGAEAKWATLAIAIPSNDMAWLSEFSAGFFACAAQYNVDLIGGDTTRGPLTISVQIMGEVPNGQALKRSGAIVGDEVWVSGRLGDAALALAQLQGQLTLPTEVSEQCLAALHTPQPRLALGLALRGLANSAIDISDGLCADLGHILAASKVGAELQLSAIPYLAVSSIVDGLKDKRLEKAVLAGGDDYELCFSAPVAHHAEIMLLSKKLGLALTVIGEITDGTKLIVRGLDQEILDFKETGFDHFN